MKHKKAAVLILCFLFIIALVNPGCKSNPIDDMIDKYEAVLVKWESKAKGHPLTETDIMNIDQELAKAGVNTKQLFFEKEKITDAQEKRFEALEQRFMALEEKISN